MPTVQEQVVSKIRAASKGLPAMQKRILATAKKKGADWICVTSTPAVYCIFQNRKCLYVGQSQDILARIYRGHPVARGKRVQVYYFPLADIGKFERSQIEEELAWTLKPAIGFIRGMFRAKNPRPRQCRICGYKWLPRTARMTPRCPNQLCQTPHWRGPKGSGR